MKKRLDPPKQPAPNIGEPGTTSKGQTDTASEDQLPDDFAQWLDERTFDEPNDGDQ